MGAGASGAASVAQIVHDAVSTLTAAGLSAAAARVDATLLARWCLRWDATTWLTRSREAPPPEFPGRFALALSRREAREPISHITGEREFYGRIFRVTPDVLTPRPESEFVIDEALAALRVGSRPDRGWAVADVGTGSGCLAVTLVRELAGGPHDGITVQATDISPAALRIAADNASRLGAAAAIRFAQADLLGGASAASFDAIVANPPYIANPSENELAPEVLREPRTALFAGRDGLDVIRRLIPAAALALVPGGHLVMEIGYDQEAAAVGLVGVEPHLRLVRVARDLQQLPRVVVARRENRL